MLENYKRLLLFLADSGGCGFFRIQMPSMYIEKYGFEYIKSNVMHSEIMGWPAFSDRGGICVLQRQYNEPNYKNAVAMKKSGIKLIFEVDDYLHDVDRYSPAYETYKKGAPVHQVLYKFYELCDAITVSTEPLRQKLLKYNPNVYVVPNSFILDDWRVDKLKHNSINILWSGSSTHYSDLVESGAADAVKAILKKYPNVKLITAGWDCNPIFKDVPGFQRIHYPWDANIKNISKFYRMADIGIAPIKQMEFNECKSSNKWVEYGLTETATIATKFGPYADTIRHGEDGLLVKNRFDKWYKALEKLIKDEELRRSITTNAKKRCTEEYDIEKNIVNWVKVYNKVLGLPEDDGIIKE